MTVSQVPLNGSVHNSMNAVEEEEVDLVIVGAGPTGLFSALLARQLGLSVCVLDAKEGPLRVGGADALTARAQQYLEVAGNFEKGQTGHQDGGILGELLNQGVKCSTSTTFADGVFTSRQSHWWTSLPHTFYTTLLMIGQPFIERHLAAHTDAAIHYAEPALSFAHVTSPSGGVTVTTAKRTVRARYCIGADGARSFLRRQLGIGWEGDKPNMVWTVLDCWIETDFPVCREIVTGQVGGESRLAWIPRERGMQRFYILLDGEITQKNAEESIRRHLAPYTINFTHVEWFSRFEIKERLASTFLHPLPSGPFILAGDSAHVHSVNGGQSMNTGLSDAFSLIWRLYFSLRFPGAPALGSQILHSYDTERRATAKQVIDVAAKLVRSTTSAAKGYVQLIEKNAGFISGMGVRYDGLGSAMLREGEKGIFKAGCRCPDLWLQTPGTEAAPSSTRLYQHILYGRYLLLLVGEPAGVEYHAKNGFAMVVKVRPLKSANVGVEKNEEEGFEDQDETEGLGCALVKKGERFAVLVRPDCYIEAVGDVDDVLGYAEERMPGLVQRG